MTQACRSQIFLADTCYYHLVVHVNEQETNSWSNEEVCRRWLQLYANKSLVERWLSGEAQTSAEKKTG